MQALATLDFDTLLDAGAAEGYNSFLVKKCFGVEPVVCDLSEDACRRAWELYSFSGVTVDLHDLPFADNAFDLVLCSESLEHVTDYKNALDELLRITRRHLVITVPHEIPSSESEEEYHAHINAFTVASLSYLQARGLKIEVRRLLSPLLTIPAALIDASPRSHNKAWKHPEFMTNIYNRLVPIAGKLFGAGASALLIRLDELACRYFRFHKGLLFVISKNDCLPASKRGCRITPGDIIGATVPPLLINRE
jgi:ubiquinone/menaquinone biosynthesis C-methylase UbiE